MLKWYRIFCEADGGAGAGGTDPAGSGDPSGGAGGDPSGGSAGDDPAAGGAPPVKNIFEAGADPEPVVPEEYEFKLAEGLEITDELKAKFSEAAKGMKLTQDQADQLLKMHSDVLLDVIHQAENQRNEWAQQCEKQGLASKENLSLAKNALKVFGGSEAMEILVATGAANHPAVQKMLQNIGSLLAEDKVPDGDNPKPQPTSDADILFANSKY